MKRVGIIVAGSAYPMDGFKSEMAALGWVDGDGICYELRAAEGQLHRLKGFASELVGSGVDLIVVIGAVTVRVVREVTSTIPIVFAIVVEPIGDGLATNLERPGGNVTGVTTFDPRQAETQLGFLSALVPGMEWVAILSDRGVSDCMSGVNERAERDMKLRPQVIRSRPQTPNTARPLRRWNANCQGREEQRAVVHLCAKPAPNSWCHCASVLRVSL